MKRTKLSTTLALLFAIGAMTSGCASTSQTEAAARQLLDQKNQEVASPRSLATRYSGALERFGDLLDRYRSSGKPIYVQTRSIGDSTGLSHPLVGSELPSDITEMVRSSVNRIGSKMVYVPFQPDYVSAHAQMGAKIQVVQPDVQITGAITEFDRALSNVGKGINTGISFGGGRGQTDANLERKSGTTISDLSLDLNVVDFATQTMIPRTQAANTIQVLNQTQDNSFDFAIIGNGFGVISNTRYLQGRHGAIRLLVELSVLQALGRYTNVPYWRCIPNAKPDPVVLDNIKRNYAKNDRTTKIKWLQESLKDYGFPIMANGNLDPGTRLAVDELASRLKLQNKGDYLDAEIFTGIYVNVPFSRPAAVSGTRPKDALS